MSCQSEGGSGKPRPTEEAGIGPWGPDPRKMGCFFFHGALFISQDFAISQCVNGLLGKKN